LKNKEGNSFNKYKKEKHAAALKYDPDKDIAPVLVAKGSGFVADNILKKAAENNVPVIENSALAEVLNTMELGSEIPSELYQAVAEILAFVINLDSKYGKYEGVGEKLIE
jgi:flagellar biosynthesis protein